MVAVQGHIGHARLNPNRLQNYLLAPTQPNPAGDNGANHPRNIVQRGGSTSSPPQTQYISIINQALRAFLLRRKRAPMQIVLYEPEIPPNTGNVARLSAAFGVPLHLIEPLGFKLEDRYLKRAGLDYWPHVRLKVWPSFEAYLEEGRNGHRLVMSSARNGEPIQHFRFSANDAIVMGPETRGLPEKALELADARVRIAIHNTVRSINLSSATAIFVYQALAGSGLLDEIS